MSNNYEEIINGLNEGKIESIIFSIKEYTHYKKCIIKRCNDYVCNDKHIVRIEVKLVEDGSETVCFINILKTIINFLNLEEKEFLLLNKYGIMFKLFK